MTATHPSDTHLTAAIITARTTGDDTALSSAAWALVGHHMAGLVWHARKYTRADWGTDGFEDYLAELRLSAFRQARTIDPTRGSSLAWLTYTGTIATRRMNRARYQAPTAEQRPYSLDAPNDDGWTLGDTLTADDVDVPTQLTRLVQADTALRLLSQLPERDRQLIAAGLCGVTNRQVAAELGVTHQAVSQAHHKALARLAHPISLRQIVRGEVAG